MSAHPSVGEFLYMQELERLRRDEAQLQYERWWNSLTPEQQAAERARHDEQAKRERAAAERAARAELQEREAAQRAHAAKVTEVTTRVGADRQRRIEHEIATVVPITRDAGRPLSLLERSQNPIITFLICVAWIAGLIAVGIDAGAFLVTALFPAWVLVTGVSSRIRRARGRRAQQRLTHLRTQLGCGDPDCAVCNTG